MLDTWQVNEQMVTNVILSSNMTVFFLLQDFGVMFLHHFIAVFLLSVSYINNMLRIGTLICTIHDSADSLLEVIFLSFVLMSIKPKIQDVFKTCTFLCSETEQSPPDLFGLSPHFIKETSVSPWKPTFLKQKVSPSCTPIFN